MGALQSTEEKAKKHSRAIDKQLRYERGPYERFNKDIVVAGYPGSGRSTLTKQIQNIIYPRQILKEQYQDEEEKSLTEMKFLYKGFHLRFLSLKENTKIFLETLELNYMIFCVALSDYDEFDIDNQNKLSNSLSLFESICKKTNFETSRYFIFLNKWDLFVEKLKETPLTVCYPDYKGANTAEEAVAYIEKLFAEVAKLQEGHGTCFTTCANDRNEIRGAIDLVIDFIIRDERFYRRCC